MLFLRIVLLLVLGGANRTSALVLDGESLIVDAAFSAEGGTLFTYGIVATDSDIHVIDAGYLAGSHGVELRGDSLLEIDTAALSRSEIRSLDVYDDSQVFLRGGLLSESGSGFAFHDRSRLEIDGVVLSETAITLSGDSSATLTSGGLATYAGLTLAENATFLMTGGFLALGWSGLSFGGAHVEISGGQIQESALGFTGVGFDAGLSIIRGGEWSFPGSPGTRGWVIGDGLVVVYGSGLAVAGGRLTGTLADGHWLDVPVEGNLQNLSLVPEPSTGLLILVSALICVSASGRRRPGCASTGGSAWTRRGGRSESRASETRC